MKFSTLTTLTISSILGLSSIVETYGEQVVQDFRNLLKKRTRKPRMHKTEIIADLQSQLSVADSQLSASSAKIAALEANVTASMNKISTLETKVAACTVRPSVLPTKAPTPRPSTVTVYPVNPFALMGYTHTAIRGWILQMQEDCMASVSSYLNQSQMSKTIQTVQTLIKLINTHMQHENDGFFIAVDNKFNCTAKNQGYRDEHVGDVAEQSVLNNFTNMLSSPNISLSGTYAVCAEMYHYASDHEAHMVHEETYLAPLTTQFSSLSRPSVVRQIIMTNFNTTYDFFAATALTQLVKRSNVTYVGTYLTALKRVLTPGEYLQVLPSIINATGSIWPSLALRGLNSTSSGTYTIADDQYLPAGIFNSTSSCV